MTAIIHIAYNIGSVHCCVPILSFVFLVFSLYPSLQFLFAISVCIPFLFVFLFVVLFCIPFCRHKFVESGYSRVDFTVNRVDASDELSFRLLRLFLMF